MNDANLTLFAIFQILVVAIVCPANKVISSHLVSKQAAQLYIESHCEYQPCQTTVGAPCDVWRHLFSLVSPSICAVLHHGQCPGPGHAYDCHVIIVVSSAGDIRQTDTAFALLLHCALCLFGVQYSSHQAEGYYS